MLQHSSIIPRAAGQTHAWQIIVIKKNGAHLCGETCNHASAEPDCMESERAGPVFCWCAYFNSPPSLLPKCIQTAFLLRECNPPLPAPCLPSYRRCLKSAQPIIQRRLRLAEPDCSVHKSTRPHVRAQVVNHDCQKTLE